MLLALKPAAGSSSCVVAPSKAHVAVGTAAPKTVPCWRRHATATFNNNSRRRATLMSATGGSGHTTPGMDALSGDAERREIAPGTPRYAHREVPAESTSPGLPTPAGRTVGDETAATIQGRRIFQDAATTDMSPPAEVGNPILTSAGLMAAMVAGPDEELPGDEVPPQYNVVFDRDRMSGGGIAGVTGTEGVPGGPHGEYRHDVVGGGGDVGDVGGGGGGATR